MNIANLPVRLSPAEETLVAQLASAGAQDASDRLAGSGLPTRRSEPYHYTDLKALIRDVPPPAKVAASVSPPALRVPGAYRLLIVNGDQEDAATAPAGVIVGRSAGSPLTTRDDILVRLNQALVTDSLSLELDGSVDPIIHIEHRTEGDAAHVADAIRLFIGDDSSATIVETYSGSDEAHFSNHGAYLALGKNATLTHITIDLSGGTARHFSSAEYLIAEGAKLRTLTIHAGSALSRTQLFARFAGAGAHADFTGLNLASDGQHHDITLEVSHAVAGTTSQEVYKQVARGRSRAVFQGKIIVARDAQKTDAKMMMQGLMLSDEAEIFSKPELEIFADDVVCGHGSTCGDIDDKSLFYLMSRGIPRAEAAAMLTRAFIEELFEFATDNELAEALRSVADDWLTREPA